MSIVEYLSENYEIEQELNKGKYIANYDRAITYPVRVHVYFEDKIFEVIRSISGFKAPSDVEYREEHIDINIEPESKPICTQFGTSTRTILFATMICCISVVKRMAIRLPIYVFRWLVVG